VPKFLEKYLVIYKITPKTWARKTSTGPLTIWKVLQLTKKLKQLRIRVKKAGFKFGFLF